MSITSITDAQRYNLGYTIAIAHTDTQRFLQETQAPSDDVAALIEPDLQSASDALYVAGFSPALPSTDATVADGDTIAVKDADGASVNSIASVANNKVTAVTMPAANTLVANTATISVTNSSGSLSANGTATVADGKLSKVTLIPAVALVPNSETVTVQNSAGAQAHTGTATVATGAITAVKLAATAAIVDNSEALTVPVTGTYATTATLTVANGVVTAIALS